MRYMLHKEACEKNPVGTLVFGNHQLGQVLFVSNEYISGNILQQIFPLNDNELCHVFEHADLLKLKAAVEKALEVTPKPPLPRYVRSDFNSKHVLENRNGEVRWKAEFTTEEAAEEYVAWKNAQEKP
jgi:hypothetical protein